MRVLGAVLAAAVLTACVAVAPAPSPGPGKSQGHGPPPHAPAHGYRAKTPQGVDLVFDTQIGVYVVVALPGQYWLDGRYYRENGKGWVVAVGVDGPWTACAVADLPPGLRSGKVPPGKAKPKKSKAGESP